MKNRFNFFAFVGLIVVGVLNLVYGAEDLYQKTSAGFLGETAITAVAPNGKYAVIASRLGGKQVMEVQIQMQIGSNIITTKSGLVLQNEEDLNHYNSIECLWAPYRITLYFPYQNTEFEPLIDQIKKEGYYTEVDVKKNIILKKVEAHIREKICALAFSNDSKLIASSGWFDSNSLLKVGKDEKGNKILIEPEYSPQDVPIKIWLVNGYNLVLLKVLKGHKSGVPYLTFSSDNKQLVSYGYKGEIIIWDLDTGEIVNRIKTKITANCISLSQDGKILAVGDKDTPSIHIFDIETGTETKVLKGYDKKCVNSVAFSRDGRFLASGGTLQKNKSIIIWNTSDWTPIFTELGHKKNVLTLSFDPESKYLVSGDEKDNVCLWDAESGKLLKTLDKDAVGSFDSEINYTENDEVLYFDSKAYEIKRIKLNP